MSDRPVQLAAYDIANLRRMLGLSSKNRKSYRNYFVAAAGDVASMERLRAAGLVVKNERYCLSDAPCYHATVAGAQRVGLKELPQVSDQPPWLKVCTCNPYDCGPGKGRDPRCPLHGGKK